MTSPLWLMAIDSPVRGLRRRAREIDIRTSSMAFWVAASGSDECTQEHWSLYVRQLEEVGVQSRLPERFAEQGLMRPGRAGGHHDPVEPVFVDALS